MNILTSLKALLFSSTTSRVPSEGTGLPSLRLDGAMDFAKLFSGSIADAKQGARTPVSEGERTALADAVSMENGVDSLPAVEVPIGLGPASDSQAQPSASAAWRSADSPFPPGLALGLVKHAAATQAPSSRGRAGAVATALASSRATIETPMPISEAVGAEMSAPAAATTPAAPVLKRADAIRRDGPVRQEAEGADLPAEVDIPMAEKKPSPAASDEQADSEAERVVAAPAMILPLSVPAILPVTEPAPVSVPAEGRAPMAQGQVPLAIAPAAAPVAQPSAAPDILSAEAVPPASPALPAERILRQAPDGGPRAPRDRQRELSPTQSSTLASADPLPVSSGHLTRMEGTPAGTVLQGKPIKVEALALLQMVREQAAAKPPGARAQVGEHVSMVANVRKHQAPATVEPTAGAPAILPDGAGPPVPVVASPSAVPTVPLASAPVVDLSANLGAQVIDMGVSGQWIDGLARDIAGLSANGAQGRFHLNTDQLGAVQVDIRQGSEGAAVSLTVASAQAEMALRQDSDRLKLDAGLSAVRIAEVKIERAPVADAARAEGANQQSSQQQSQHGSSQSQWAWANGNQDMSQPQGQQVRWQARQNNAFESKLPADPTVLNHEQGREGGSEATRARYA